MALYAALSGLVNCQSENVPFDSLGSHWLWVIHLKLTLDFLGFGLGLNPLTMSQQVISSQ